MNPWLIAALVATGVWLVVSAVLMIVELRGDAMSAWLIAALVATGVWLVVSAVLMIVGIITAPLRGDWD